MKHLITILFFLCAFTMNAQTRVVTGPTKQKPTTSAAKPKPKPQQPAKPKPAAKPKPQQPTKPTRSPQELRTETFTVNGVSFKMCYVKGGSFLMGATPEQGSEEDCYDKPVHKVTLSDYYIGQTEVTQALWQAVMGSNPSKFKGDNLPVERVSWNDCQEFLEKLNAKTGRTFHLPTEAQWEFAARGGNNSRDYKYSGSNYPDDVAWYDSNSMYKTHNVATKQANELGIYDMSGNVWEWCSDWYASDYYKNSDANNPRGAYTGSCRVLRGGGWINYARYCHSSYRCYDVPSNRYGSLGLRLAL